MPFKYFTDSELSCSHCQKNDMNVQFMDKIVALREELGFPFIVTSGFRCPEHPVEERKASPGAHSSGHALDIAIAGKDAYRLLEAALGADFTGIGVNQKGKARFIHLDDIENSSGRPRPWVWSY